MRRRRPGPERRGSRRREKTTGGLSSLDYPLSRTADDTFGLQHQVRGIAGPVPARRAPPLLEEARDRKQEEGVGLYRRSHFRRRVMARSRNICPWTALRLTASWTISQERRMSWLSFQPSRTG